MKKTPQIADFTNDKTNPLPDQAQELVRYLLEGRVASMLLCAEVIEADGTISWLEGYVLDMDGNKTNRRAFAGSVDLLHRDLAEDLQFDTVTVEIGLDDDEDEEEE